MSVLRSLESKLEGLVQGAFSRAFKSRVQPVEIARKLAKEMDDHKAVSISRVYVPNAYTVYLSPADREGVASYEQGLQRELSDYLLEHARTEGLALLTRPTVEFTTDERLRLGEFGIQAELVEPPEAAEAPSGPPPPSFGHTMVYSPDREARPLEAPPRVGLRALAARGRGQAPRAHAAAGDGRALVRVRHRDRRPQRLPPPRRAAGGGRAAGSWPTSAPRTACA